MSNNKVFISHSSNDRPTAIALCNYLEAHNINCWMAPRNINVGRDYAQSIMEAIESSAIMILILSNASSNSKHVRNEIERAFNHQLVIMAFRIQDIMPGKTLEYFLGATHWLDAFDEKPEKYFSLLLDNCNVVLHPDENISTENKHNNNPQAKSSKTKYLFIALLSLVVLSGIFFLFEMNNKKPLDANKNIINADSAVTKNNDGSLLLTNKDSNKTSAKKGNVGNTIKSPEKISAEKTPEKTDEEETKASVHLPETVNAVYWQPATNDVLTISSSGYFSGTVQNKPVTGELKSGAGKSYKLSGYHISGNISFSSDYNSFSGSIFLSDLGVSAKLEMVKK